MAFVLITLSFAFTLWIGGAGRRSVGVFGSRVLGRGAGSVESLIAGLDPFDFAEDYVVLFPSFRGSCYFASITVGSRPAVHADFLSIFRTNLKDLV